MNILIFSELTIRSDDCTNKFGVAPIVEISELKGFENYLNSTVITIEKAFYFNGENAF